MKTHSKRLRIAAWILPLALLVVGCDSTISGPEVVDPSPKNPDDRRTLVISIEPLSEGLVFRTSGSIHDEGVVEGPAMPTEGSVHGKRTLKGQQGTLTIEYEGGVVSEEPLALEGAFKIVGRTGAYTVLRGDSGEFRCEEDEEGILEEMFWTNEQ